MVFWNIRNKHWQTKLKRCGNNVSLGRPSMIKGLANINIDNNSRLNDGAWLTAWSGEIVIGKNCQFGAFNHISCANRIVIGDGFLSGKWVSIVDNSHGNTDLSSLKQHPAEREIYSKGPIIIGKDVWIGDKATVLGGCVIGDGAVIGANAVVTHDVPAYSVVVGNPARVIRVNDKR